MSEAELKQLTAAELLRRGGEWLGAARRWLQWHTLNGDRVTWGSLDVIEPQLSVRQIEDLAAEVAAAAMRPQPSEERLESALRARWKAEAAASEAYEVVRQIRSAVDQAQSAHHIVDRIMGVLDATDIGALGGRRYASDEDKKR